MPIFRISKAPFAITDEARTSNQQKFYRISVELSAKKPHRKRGNAGPKPKNERPAPASVRRRKLSLARPGDRPPLRLVAAEVVDEAWWAASDNPFGAKLWPSSLAVARFLVRAGPLNRDVLELGCGAGLISIAAAADGARAVASDVSETVLGLTRLGWDATRRRGGEEAGRGSLATLRLDLASRSPLPIEGAAGNGTIVAAAAMMYGEDLAKLLARRVYEACARGAWVIVGDDDTGEREGGRRAFMSEFARLEQTNGKEFPSTWTKSIVKEESLKWNEKRVQILHLNQPSDITLDG